jgi:hypothetical protein
MDTSLSGEDSGLDIQLDLVAVKSELLRVFKVRKRYDPCSEGIVQTRLDKTFCPSVTDPIPTTLAGSDPETISKKLVA